jgi:hypothetical protein
MSSTPIFDMRQALRQAQEHLDAGRITAQRGIKAPLYIHEDDIRCIIGAMLPEEITQKLYAQANDRTIRYVRKAGWLEISERDFQNLLILQLLHDHVCEGKVSLARFMSVFEQIKRSYAEEPSTSAA